jgi:hypothetical protein
MCDNVARLVLLRNFHKSKGIEDVVKELGRLGDICLRGKERKEIVIIDRPTIRIGEVKDHSPPSWDILGLLEN